jgi:hypothetical protein
MANTITELLRDDDHHIIRLVQVIYQQGDPEYDHRRLENVWILYTPLVQGTIGDMLSPKRHSICLSATSYRSEMASFASSRVLRHQGR